ncbi:hypothetical protein HCU74_09480 [Spongiibacter sp. KMU-166]|uniref:Uncharacterized protein n=1 Tax=Spongiibacter thalassae TaxID=2721624 RepID=A0ABX1GEM8_9GAMM|nr:hypothetical protein [Spongiibacter thalassae]NKI17650.1 hypothetical protein [Spongiibacter thalassae]
MALITILGFLALSLIVLIPLIERFSPQMSAEKQQSISRWILPLVGVSIVIALFKHWMG